MEPTNPQPQQRFRILSLDGGGIRGAFTASVLATLEEDTKLAAADHFDLITGTSTGGIIALGLGLGLPASKIRDFYRDQGPAIFPSTGFLRGWWRTVLHLFRPKRSHDELAKALTSVFENRQLGESRTRLVIPTYDAVAGRVFLLKTAHDKRFDADYGALAVDCALATAAAPTYFRAARFPKHPGASYIDGGVWANCPALVGLIEATAFLGKNPEQVDILSIGTTTEPFSVSQGRRLGGILHWNKGILNLLMKGQEQAALAQVGLLAGSFYRIDAVVCGGRYSLDNARKELIEELIALGFGEAKKKERQEVVRARFLTGMTVPPFVPAHRLSLEQSGRLPHDGTSDATSPSSPSSK